MNPWNHVPHNTLSRTLCKSCWVPLHRVTSLHHLHLIFLLFAFAAFQSPCFSWPTPKKIYSGFFVLPHGTHSSTPHTLLHPTHSSPPTYSFLHQHTLLTQFVFRKITSITQRESTGFGYSGLQEVKHNFGFSAYHNREVTVIDSVCFPLAINHLHDL